MAGEGRAALALPEGLGDVAADGRGQVGRNVRGHALDAAGGRGAARLQLGQQGGKDVLAVEPGNEIACIQNKSLKFPRK